MKDCTISNTYVDCNLGFLFPFLFFFKKKERKKKENKVSVYLSALGPRILLDDKAMRV